MPNSNLVPKQRLELVEELLSFLSINRVTSWSPASLGVDHATFEQIVQGLFELEAREIVDVLSLGRDQSADGQRLSQVKFLRMV